MLFLDNQFCWQVVHLRLHPAAADIPSRGKATGFGYGYQFGNNCLY